MRSQSFSWPLKYSLQCQLSPSHQPSSHSSPELLPFLQTHGKAGRKENKGHVPSLLTREQCSHLPGLACHFVILIEFTECLQNTRHINIIPQLRTTLQDRWHSLNPFLMTDEKTRGSKRLNDNSGPYQSMSTVETARTTSYPLTLGCL